MPLSNFEALWKKNSLENVLSFYQVISKMRKNKHTKKEKIDAICNQIKFMNAMNRVGKNEGGSEKVKKFNQDCLTKFNQYSKDDVDYLFKSLKVPYCRTKKDLLNKFEDIYDLISFLDFNDDTEL